MNIGMTQSTKSQLLQGLFRRNLILQVTSATQSKFNITLGVGNSQNDNKKDQDHESECKVTFI